MVDCPNGNKIIEWQYPGKELNRILGADSYTFKLSWYGGQNPNIRYRLKYSDSSGTFYSNQPAQIISPISDVVVYANNVPIEGYEFAGRGRPTYVTVLDATGNWKTWLYLTRADNFKFFGFEPADGSIETNPGGGSCIFTIYKSVSIVYQETKNICPQATEYCGEKCPPGTCECTHGSVVCCHDSKTGEVVKTFRR